MTQRKRLLLGLWAALLVCAAQAYAPPATAENTHDKEHLELHTHLPDTPVHHFGRLETCKGWWAP
jgi:hypothetical protein